MKLIIEVDGGQHNLDKEKDKIRDDWFKKEGKREKIFDITSIKIGR